MDQFQQAFREYLALEKKYSPHTVNAYTRDLDFFAEFLKTEFVTNRKKKKVKQGNVLVLVELYKRKEKNRIYFI